LDSHGPLAAFGSGNGPAEASIIRKGRAALILVAAAAHPFPALFFPGEFNEKTPIYYWPYYSRPFEEFSMAKMNESIFFLS
jgi:hypothetical protein